MAAEAEATREAKAKVCLQIINFKLLDYDWLKSSIYLYYLFVIGDSISELN